MKTLVLAGHTKPPVKPKGNYGGYHECPCRDCFEIAIGAEPDGSASLCQPCAEYGCDGEGECLSPAAYGQLDD